jgi:nucleoside-diphosphate-sugar epimerase
MQNLTTTHLHEIRDERRIFVPAGDGQTNFVDVRDIGEAIATTLLDPPGENSAYEITGPADLTYYEVAGKLSDHLEIDITYVPAGLLPFFRYHRARGKKFGFILVMYILYRTTKKGKAAGKSPDLQRLIGRPPRSLDEFIVDHKQLFVRNGTDG